MNHLIEQAIQLLEQGDTGKKYRFEFQSAVPTFIAPLTPIVYVNPIVPSSMPSVEGTVSELFTDPSFEETVNRGHRVFLYKSSIGKLDPADWAWFKHQAALRNILVGIKKDFFSTYSQEEAIQILEQGDTGKKYRWWLAGALLPAYWWLVVNPGPAANGEFVDADYIMENYPGDTYLEGTVDEVYVYITAKILLKPKADVYLGGWHKELDPIDFVWLKHLMALNKIPLKMGPKE